jgi:hypothetical protein
MDQLLSYKFYGLVAGPEGSFLQWERLESGIRRWLS